jgi:transposase/IS5 family transposase
MSGKFTHTDRRTPFIFPPTIEDWLPEDHLARFVVEIVSQLNLSSIRETYSELARGQKAYEPAMMVALIFYCLITGILSSRKMERATWESIPVRYITGDEHPDHDTIADFRNRMKDALDRIFVDILRIAQGMGVLKLGTISLDGTKMHANASKHKAMSYAHACKLEEQLKSEIAQLIEQSQREDKTEKNPVLDVPEEIHRREERLVRIAEVKAEIERREHERYEQEKAEYDRKMKEREKREEETGKKIKGQVPKEPEDKPKEKAQVNLTDGDSRIMPVSGGGFEQSYNAQAAVDVASRMIVGERVTQACNDKEELKPMLEKLEDLPEELGNVDKILCDAGYYSEENLEAAEEAGITPLIPAGREKHNERLEVRMNGAGEEPKESAGVSEQTAYRLKTEEGRREYGQRKSVSEPVFGIIKSAMGYRALLRRGIEKVRAEWTLICVGYNLKRLSSLFRERKGLLYTSFEIMPQR